MSVCFEVLGIPKPKGSKKFWGMSKKGKPIIAEQSNNTDWINAVHYAAKMAMDGKELFEGPVSVSSHFTVPIPKTLDKKFRQNKICRYPIKRNGDCDKLLRGIYDAMIGVVYVDDSQVCKGTFTKVYGFAPGVWIEVAPIE
jgi:Holliday junction resolvase RusA-like endonuclease